MIGATRHWYGLSWVRSLLLSLCLMVALGACAATQGDGATQDRTASGEDPASIRQMLAELRKNSKLREVAALYCSALLTESESVSYQPFMASFFNVSRDEAGLTLCRVLIEAVISNELTEQEVDRIEDPQNQDDFVLFGAVLRKLLVAQERLNSQQVGRPPLIAAGADRSARRSPLPGQK